MAESSNTKVTGVSVDEKDIISELPGHLQETIVNRLSIQDAVRTSTLSKQWRYCWTKIPDIMFGNQFLNYMSEKLSVYNHNPDHKAAEFFIVIQEVLQLHNGPILRFDLGFPNDLSSEIVGEYINNQLIPLLSARSVKQLVLEDYSLDGPGYYLDAHKLSSLNLTHLTLRGLQFHSAPAFGGFSYLTKLFLFEVIKTDFDGVYIFHCPVLKSLMLANCLGIFHTNFNAPNLTFLYEKNTDMPLSGLENITRFIFILEVPNITKKYNVAELLGSLFNIEDLFIEKYSIQYLAAGGSPNKVTKPLQFLKTLSVSDANLADVSVLSCLFCLIRSGPNLRKLQIWALTEYNSDDQVTQDDFELKDWKDCTMGLRIVELENLKGFIAEMQLIEFLLGHCPLLETMLIYWSGDVDRDTASTMEEVILEFSTVSPRAQIRCSSEE